jgi:hypothetical protein
VRLRLEQLEDRTLMSNFFAATVSDLIADINAANKVGGTNSITLAADQTFTITQVDNSSYYHGPNGLPVIALGDNLTMVGNGDTIQRDNKSAAFRFFEMAGGATLTLIDLALQNGLSSSIYTGGGAILNYGVLTASSCTLTNNSTSGIPVGGAIYNGGAVTLQNSTLHNNTAFDGGGIYNNPSGSLTIGGCILSHNSATNDGGAILNDGGVVTLCNDTLTFNTAEVGGGGIFGATVYIDPFTLANTIKNKDSSGVNGSTANIDGPYILRNC